MLWVSQGQVLVLPSPGSSSPEAPVRGWSQLQAVLCYLGTPAWCPADQGVNYLRPEGITEVGYPHQEPSLAVGQEVWERVKVAWEGCRRWWLGQGNLLPSSRACLGLLCGAVPAMSPQG